MCEELGLTFVEEAYVDVDWNERGKVLPVADSNMATPQDIYQRARSIGLHDHTVDNQGNPLKLGFDGRPFSICIHSDMPTALDNVKECRRAVEEVIKEKGY